MSASKQSVFRVAILLIVVLAFAAARLVLHNRPNFPPMHSAAMNPPAAEEATSGSATAEAAAINPATAPAPAPALTIPATQSNSPTSKHTPPTTKTVAAPDDTVKAVG